MSMGFVELERARIARQESERATAEEARIQAEIDAQPTEEENAARELLERRYAAHDEAALKVARDASAAADRALEEAKDELNAALGADDFSLEKIGSKWVTFREAAECDDQLRQLWLNSLPWDGPGARPRSPRHASASMRFADVLDEAIERRAKLAGQVSVNEVQVQRTLAGNKAFDRAK